MAEVDEVSELSRQIYPLFAGREPEVVGAVLADLLAILLVGFRDKKAREELLEIHIKAVRNLIVVNEGMLREHRRRKNDRDIH